MPISCWAVILLIIVCFLWVIHVIYRNATSVNRTWIEILQAYIFNTSDNNFRRTCHVVLIAELVEISRFRLVVRKKTLIEKESEKSWKLFQMHVLFRFLFQYDSCWILQKEIECVLDVLDLRHITQPSPPNNLFPWKERIYISSTAREKNFLKCCEIYLRNIKHI